MGRTGRFLLAVALGVVLAAAAVAGTTSRSDKAGLPVNELLRLEPLPSDPTSPLDDHLRYQFEILGGNRQFVEDDIAARFTTDWPLGFVGDALNVITDADPAEHGEVNFVRVEQRHPQLVVGLGVVEDGTPIQTLLQVTDDGRIELISFGPDNDRPARLPSWESTLILLAGWGLIAASVMAWRYGAATEAWTLLAALIPTLAGVLILSGSSTAYTAGRIVPGTVVVLAAVLLVGPKNVWSARWPILAAAAAAICAAVAPLVLDSSPIGHPAAVGRFADDEALFRALLVASGGLTFLAMAGLAVLTVGRLRRAGGQQRPARLVATALAGVWAAAALVAAIDNGIGDGTLASGPMRAIMLSTLAVLPASVVFGLAVPDQVMRHAGLFAVALTLGALLAVAAVGGTMVRSGRAGLPENELLRVEPMPSDPTSILDDHLQFVFDVVGGTRRFTEADMGERFTPGMAADVTAAGVNVLIKLDFTAYGLVMFVREIQREPPFITALGVAEDGTPIEVVLGVVDDGGLNTLGVDPDPRDPRRLPLWEATLSLLAGWGLIVAAAAAWRYRAGREAWTLLAGAIPTLAAVMVLSDSSLAYSAGRVIPSLLVVVGVALLLDPDRRGVTRLVMALAVAAAIVGAVAPFVRHSSLIGHPSVVGAFTDNEALYRGLLSSSAGLTFLALGGVAAITVGGLNRASGQLRPAMLVTIPVAAMWALAAFGSFVDYGFGSGTLASGPFRAIAWSALVLTSAAVSFRLVTTSWDRLELASLVIDLESEGTDLQPAVAKALDDPSLEILTSPDGDRLQNDAGDVVVHDELPEGRDMTLIRAGGRLMGGLMHAAVLRRNPARLEAVAAAAGMALHVSQLNKEVTAQLVEVDASRARILEASDTARRQVERDLHDGAQQRLVSVGLQLQKARRQASSQNQDQLAELLDHATKEVRDAMEEVRAVSRGRQPTLLAERGLATAVDALAERTPVPVEVYIAAGDLPDRTEKTAYYVIAEGLTNLAKHARATRAHVSISRPEGVACVTVDDDGRGGAKMTSGSGLEGLSDRVAATGGTFTIISGPNGTKLEAMIPCD